jgi:kumamolisin
MPARQKFITLQKSKRLQPAGAQPLKLEVAPDERIEVTVIVRPRSSAAQRRAEVQALARQFPRQRKHLTFDRFSKLHGARADDLKLVERFAGEHQLDVVESSAAKRSVILAGAVAAFGRAFHVNFQTFRHRESAYRSFTDQIQIPASLEGVVEVVLGLDNRELMSHHAFLAVSRADGHTQPHEVMEAYDFPSGVEGRGECVAIIELGGGFHESDIKQYFDRHRFKLPRISIVEIGNQKNDPASPELIKKVLDAMGLESASKTASTKIDPAEASHAMWTIESTLDVELIGSFANAADIVVYFAPNNAQGKYQALSTALNSKEHPATLISCSWGAVEEELPQDFFHCMEQLFQDAVLQGVSICCSSGDRGDDPGPSGRPRVHYPASSPHVLACGGTHWTARSKLLEEVVWNETLPHGSCQSGGGASKVFGAPGWQRRARVKLKTRRSGRGLPDVAGKADIQTGYCMFVGGLDVTMGGTSAVAPMWAGLIARLNQELGKPIGYITPLLYGSSIKKAFRDILEGNNGHYRAGPGWDPCTGLGTPIGKALLQTLSNTKRRKH